MKRFLFSLFTIVLLLALAVPVVAYDQARDGPVIATAIMDMPDLAVLATTTKNITMNFDPLDITGAPLLLATFINKTKPADQRTRDVKINSLIRLKSLLPNMTSPDGEGRFLLRQGGKPMANIYIYI